jgi:hypothetical protein
VSFANFQSIDAKTVVIILTLRVVTSDESLPDRSRFLRRRQNEAEAMTSGNMRTQRFRLDRVDSNDNEHVDFANRRPTPHIRPSLVGMSSVSSTSDWQIRRRRHQDLMRDVAEDEHRTRILPKPNPLHSWSRMNEFVSDFDERDLRYLTKEGRQT